MVLPGISSGKGSVMFAIDHGYFMGPTSGLENPEQNIVPLLPFADSLMLSRGILNYSIPNDISTPIVLRVSSGNSILNEDMSNEKLCVSLEEKWRRLASLGPVDDGRWASVWTGDASLRHERQDSHRPRHDDRGVF